MSGGRCKKRFFKCWITVTANGGLRPRSIEEVGSVYWQQPFSKRFDVQGFGEKNSVGIRVNRRSGERLFFL
jgi:hypothetical protein